MIADSQTGSGFAGASKYTTSKAQPETQDWKEWAESKVGIAAHEQVDAVQTRNILMEEDPIMAAKEMRVTAGQNERVQKPRYSVSLSYHPDDGPSDQEMMRDMDDFLERRGLDEHQAVLAIHRDEEHAHIHATVNRVHPETGNLWRDSYDYFENMSALREIERERGWTQPKEAVSEEERAERGRIADWKIRRFERTGKVPFGQEVQTKAGDEFAEAETWRELQGRLSGRGLHVEKKGSGGIVTDGEEEAPLSEVARKWSFNKLDDRFPDEFKAQEAYESRQQDEQKQSLSKELQELQSEIEGHLEAGRDRLAAETFELRGEEKRETLRKNLSDEVESKLRRAQKRKEEMMKRVRPVRESLSDQGRKAWREAKVHAQAAAVARFGSAQEDRELKRAGKAWRRVCEELGDEDRATLMKNGLPSDVAKRTAEKASDEKASEEAREDVSQEKENSQTPNIEKGRGGMSL
jgi:hypothetical protein